MKKNLSNCNYLPSRQLTYKLFTAVLRSSMILPQLAFKQISFDTIKTRKTTSSTATTPRLRTLRSAGCRQRPRPIAFVSHGGHTHGRQRGALRPGAGPGRPPGWVVMLSTAWVEGIQSWFFHINPWAFLPISPTCLLPWVESTASWLHLGFLRCCGLLWGGTGGLGENHNGTKLLLMGIYQGGSVHFKNLNFIVTNLRNLRGRCFIDNIYQLSLVQVRWFFITSKTSRYTSLSNDSITMYMYTYISLPISNFSLNIQCKLHRSQGITRIRKK